MGSYDFDSAEIDRLIDEMDRVPRVPPKVTPVVGQPLADPAHAQPPADPPAAARQGEIRPVSTWTTGRLVMPSMPAPAPSLGRRLAFASAISLPQLPDLSRFFRLPGPVTVARMWVGLGAVYAGAMTYWPYPKTYLIGLVLYLLSLALVLVSGVWGARLSWEARLGAAHTVALCTIAWAIALAAAVTLPLMS